MILQEMHSWPMLAHELLLFHVWSHSGSPNTLSIKPEDCKSNFTAVKYSSYLVSYISIGGCDLVGSQLSYMLV